MDDTLVNRSERSGILTRIAVVATLLLLLVGPYFGPVPALLSTQLEAMASVFVLLAGFVVSFVIILLVALRLDGADFSQIGLALRELGLGLPTRWPAAVVGVVVGLAWGMLFLSSIRQFDPGANITQITGVRIAAALIAALGTVLEDLITRGFLMNRLAQIAVPNWAQALISALLFAAYHTIWGFNVFSFAFSVVYGLILAGLFLWGKRSLTPVILGHALAVLIAEPFATMLIFIAPGA
jgi:membrane protease YdiL (CAAX protease family)